MAGAQGPGGACVSCGWIDRSAARRENETATTGAAINVLGRCSFSTTGEVAEAEK